MATVGNRNTVLESAERIANRAWREACVEVLTTNRRGALSPEEEARAFALITAR